MQRTEIRSGNNGFGDVQHHRPPGADMERLIGESKGGMSNSENNDFGDGPTPPSEDTEVEIYVGVECQVRGRADNTGRGCGGGTVAVLVPHASEHVD